MYAALEDRRIEAVISPIRALPRRKGAQSFATEQFKFDPHQEVIRCPAKKRLTPRNSTKSGKWHSADRRDCARCPFKAQCLPQGARRVHIVANRAAIQRDRRKRWHGAKDDHAIYTRHCWRVEGAQGTTKILHGLTHSHPWRARKHENPGSLTAIAMNLKKLAAAVMIFFVPMVESRLAGPTPASV